MGVSVYCQECGSGMLTTQQQRQVGRRVRYECLDCTHTSVNTVNDPAKAKSLQLVTAEEATDIKALKDKVSHLTDKLAAVDSLSSILEAQENPAKLPAWMGKKPIKTKKSPATPIFFASDWHMDEVVNRAEVGGINEYGRAVATERARKFFEFCAHAKTHDFGAYEIDGAVLALGGDMVSGHIHEELLETNEFSIGETVVHTTEILSWGIRLLADTFTKVYVPCVAGNHGRMTKRVRSKKRQVMNYDWIIYKMLQREFAALAEAGTRTNVTIDVPESIDCYFDLHGTRYCLTHGDAFHNHKGRTYIDTVTIGNKAHKENQARIGNPYDVLMCGHFHNALDLDDAVINGSLKGMDEYGYINGLPYRDPEQTAWLTTPAGRNNFLKIRV